MKRILQTKCTALVLCLLLSSMLYAQERTVSGRVTSTEDGSPLPGVNIVIKGTAVGTATDTDGRYTLAVPDAGGSLVFSFIGLQSKEVEIGGRSVVDITLALDVTQLGEIVVTATGEREARSLGYSTAVLSSDKVQSLSEPDPLRALTGKIAGVQIGGSGGQVGGATNITIRGKGSLTGNNQPLFVVDGIPYDNSSYDTDGGVSSAGNTNRAFDIDPNNIESINILKGAAASALYGSRAANGVIVITTKSSKKNSQKGMRVSVNTSKSFEEVSKTPNIQKKYTQGGEFQYSGAFVGTWGNTYENVNASGGVPHPLDQPAFNAAFPEFIGQKILLKPNDNVRNFFNTGTIDEFGLSITSGGESANLNAGFGYMLNNGIIPHNQTERVNFNFGGNAQLDNGLQINGGISYTKTSLDGMQLGDGAGSQLMARLLFLPPSYDLVNQPFEDPLTGGSVFYRTDIDNPLWSAKNSPEISRVNRWNGFMKLGYDVKEWLNISYRFGYNGYTDRRKNVIGKGTTSITQDGRIILDDISYEELDGTLLLTVNTEITSDFSLLGTILHNVNQRTTDRQSMLGTNFILRNILDIDNTQEQARNGGDFSRRRLMGIAADITLGYRDWIFLNLVGRNDWASTLPPETRSFFYPGASVSVILSDGLDLKGRYLDFLKVRAAWAQAGSEGDSYLTQTIFDLGNPFRGITNQVESRQIGNARLRNELLQELEFGIETQHFNNRIGLNVNYYTRSTIDGIFASAIAPSSGYTSSIVNIGKVENKGWEVGLLLTPLQLTNGFTWNINAQFTRNRSKVVELGPGIDQVISDGFANIGNVHRVGQPYGMILGSDYFKDAETGKPLISSNTGLFVTNPVLQIIGDPNPDFNLAVTNSLSYKGIFFSALIDWVQGGDLYSQTTANAVSRGVLAFSADRERNRVIDGYIYDPETLQAAIDAEGNKVPNTKAVTTNEYHFIDGIGSAGALSHNVYDATVIRLREISIGYALPKAWLSKTPFGSATLSISGRNLWYHTPNFLNDMNFDPETNIGQGNNQGLEFSSVPSTRRIGFNLRFTL